MSEDGPAVEDVKRALAMLATKESPSKSREIIDIAWEATQDIDYAAAFATAGGLGKLSQAIDLADQIDDRRLAHEGQRALAAFERFRRAAVDDPYQNGDQLQDGHGMDLLEETKRGDR